jgi:hypothetical protein
MKYARKINIDFDINVEDILARTRIIIQHGQSESATKLIRRFVPKKFREKIYSKLPTKITACIQGIHLTESRPLEPHIHTTDHAVLNIYYRTHNEITAFWAGDIEHKDITAVDDFYSLVDIDKLMQVESFIAKSGDVWLLNTRQPHSVSMSDVDKNRMLLQIFFNRPFDEVVNYFYDTNSNSPQATAP